MKLFLQIEITNWQQSRYGSLLLNHASSLSNDVLGTDLDSQSESLIADLVLRLIDQAEKIFLFVQVTDSNLSLGTAQRVFAHLEKTSAKISHIILSGDHRPSEMALRNFPFLQKESDTEKIKLLIEQFSK